MKTISSIMRTSHAIFSGILCLSTCLFLSACIGPLTPSVYTDSVKIQVDPDANQTSAIAVDLVAIYDETLLKTLLTMSSDKYFQNAKQIQRDYFQRAEVFHWEVVPGQLINFQKLHYRKSSPLGAIVFARYINPGEHRQSVGSNEYLVIHLMKDGFETFTDNNYNSYDTIYKEPE